MSVAARHFIDGAYTSGSGNRNFENFNPVNSASLGFVPEGGAAEVDAAVAAANAALSGPWGVMSVTERAELLHKVADGITARFDEFFAAEVSDTGKPKSLAAHIDIPRGAANFKVFADLMKNVGSEHFSMPTPDGTGAVNYALRVPKGVIAVISPWNLPLLLMTWKVGPALACGNCVVVKPSEETPLIATLLGEVMNEAGIPKGVYNVVHGFGPDSAARGVRDVSFELGGKNPALEFADCNLDKAIEGTLRSVFANCGQVCLSTERIYVERPIFDEFTARLKAGAEALTPGAPEDPNTNLGPLISQEHRAKVTSYYARAREEGAEIITGGGVPDMPDALAGGSWIEPTIWTGLGDQSAVIREEIFGPCCHIRPFDEEEEAVALANDTPYGLCCSLRTENLSRAHRV